LTETTWQATIDRGAVEFDTANIPADFDSDGIPNDVEAQNGLNLKVAADGLLDRDGDGRSNLNEYISGTDINNNTSYFKMVRAIDLNNDQTLFEIEWTSNASIANLVYDISFSDDLSNWIPILINIPADTLPATTTTRTVPNSALPPGDVFIRIAARRIP